jgi:aryl-alcohol dehydrogenase-like predicted oxidoreductase
MDHKKPDTTFYNIPFHIESFNGMPYQSLGMSGLYVPNVGLGTWKFGYPETGDGSRVGEEQAFGIFERAIELGVTFWDTANRYNNASGNSERVIGKWLKNHPQQRRNVILATKVYGGMDGLTPNHCGLSRGNILDSVYACLERLQTNRIDVLYFHAFDTFTPIEETLTAIEDLVRQDLVRYFGVSNFTVENLNAYQAVQSNMSVRSRIVAIQNQFDILHGEPAAYNGVLNYAQQMGMSFVAWSPLARGLLSEKYLDVAHIGKGDRLFDEGIMKDRLDDATKQKLSKLATLAHQWDMKLSQLALACLLSIPGMGPVIPSSATISQLELNAAAGSMKLSEDQKSQIQQALG